MNETLKSLYDRFYTPLPLTEYEQEVETCHRQLIERLEKPERKLVLQIIDTQNHIIEERSLDSLRIPPIWEGKQSLRPTLSDLAPPETGGFRAEARAHFEIGGAA